MRGHQRRVNLMMIQRKIMRLLLITILGYGVLFSVFQYVIWQPQFDNMVVESAQKDMAKSVENLTREINHILVMSKDYALWDDSYQFVEDQNMSYIEINMTDSALESLGVQFMMFQNNQEEMVFGQYQNEAKEWLPLKASDVSSVTQTIRKDKSDSDEKSGLIAWNGNIYLLGMSRIYHSDGSGPSNGKVFFGRKLDAGMLENSNQILGIQSKIYVMDKDGIAQIKLPNSRNDIQIEDLGTGFIMHKSSRQEMKSYKVLYDMTGMEIAILEVVNSRKISIMGGQMGISTALSFTLIGVVVAFFLGFLFKSIISKPIISLSQKLQRFGTLDFESVGTEEDLNLLERDDEIGYLASSIEEMKKQIIGKHHEIKELNQHLDSKVHERTVALQETNAKLILSDKVLSETSEGVLITDASVRIVRANEALLKMCKCELKDIIGQNPKIFKSGMHDETFYTQMWKELKEKDYWAGEIWDRNMSGEVYPKWLSINIIRNEKNEITHYIGLSSDITLIKQNEYQLQQMAYYDALTGLPNRALFYERLQQAVVRAHRKKHMVALFFLDLDRFKIVNDTLGHAIGDKVLQKVAKVISQNVREMDTVSRLGGDEFTIVIDDVDSIKHVSEVANRIIHCMSQPFQVGEIKEAIQIGVSIGIAIYPKDDVTVDGLIRKADAAMYHAKESGRNGFSFVVKENTQKFHPKSNNELRAFE